MYRQTANPRCLPIVFLYDFYGCFLPILFCRLLNQSNAFFLDCLVKSKYNIKKAIYFSDNRYMEYLTVMLDETEGGYQYRGVKNAPECPKTTSS